MVEYVPLLFPAVRIQGLPVPRVVLLLSSSAFTLLCKQRADLYIICTIMTFLQYVSDYFQVTYKPNHLLNVQPKQLWPVKAWLQNLWGCPGVADTRTFVVDPLCPVCLGGGASMDWTCSGTYHRCSCILGSGDSGGPLKASGTLLCFPSHSWAVFVASQGAMSCWGGCCHEGVDLVHKGIWMSGGCQVPSTWMPGPEDSQQNMALLLSPVRVLMLWLISVY